MMQDYMMQCNARRTLSALYEHGRRNVYWFDIDCMPTCPDMGSANGVCQHTSEIAYVFGTVSSYQSSSEPNCDWTEGDNALSDLLIRDWVSFASSGKPSLAPFNPENAFQSLYFETEDRAEVVLGERSKDRCELWNRIEAEQDDLLYGQP
jgi:carboxylesterase type B